MTEPGSWSHDHVADRMAGILDSWFFCQKLLKKIVLGRFCPFLVLHPSVAVEVFFGGNNDACH